MIFTTSCINHGALKDSPIVSVVVPAYNHGRYLKECLNSILKQTYESIELIVLDDGSTDTTRDVLMSFGDRFRWERQLNLGQAATLNRGWKMSNGQFLAYISADDVLYPDAVARAVAALRANPSTVVVYPDFSLIDAKSKWLRRIYAPEFDIREMYLNLVCHPGPGAVFRRSAWLEAGPWNTELKQNPDLEFWMRVALQGDFRRIPAELAAFRVHSESQTFRPADSRCADEPIVIVRKFLERDDLPSWLLTSKARIWSAAHLTSAQLHLRAGRCRIALSYLSVAWSSSVRTVLSRRALKMMLNGLFGRFIQHIRVRSLVKWL